MSIEVEPEWWKTLFDDIYLITDARSVCDPDITRAEVDLVCRLLDLQPGHRVLDLCGGHGRHSMELYRRGITDCTLLDYSPFLIDRAKEQARKQEIEMDCVRADARHTGLPSDSFDDVIIMGNSLGYGNETGWDLHILQEARRLLCTSGHLFVDVVDGSCLRETFNPRAWHEIGEDIIVCRLRELLQNRVNAREIVLSKERGLLRDQTYSIRFYRPSSLKRLFERAGLSDIEVHTDFSPHLLDDDYGCMNNRMICIGSKV